MDEILEQEALQRIRPIEVKEAAQYTEVDLDPEYPQEVRTGARTQMDEILEEEAFNLLRRPSREPNEYGNGEGERYSTHHPHQYQHQVLGTPDQNIDIDEEEEVLRHLWPPAPPRHRPHHHASEAGSDMHGDQGDDAEQESGEVRILPFLLSEEEEAEERGMWVEEGGRGYEHTGDVAQLPLRVESDHALRHHHHDDHHEHRHDYHHGHQHQRTKEAQHDPSMHPRPDNEHIRTHSPKLNSLGALLVRLGLLHPSHPAIRPPHPCPIREHSPARSHMLIAEKERSMAELAQELADIGVLPMDLDVRKGRHGEDAEEQAGLGGAYRLQGGPEKVRGQVGRYSGRLHRMYETHGDRAPYSGQDRAPYSGQDRARPGALEHEHEHAHEQQHARPARPYIAFTRSPPPPPTSYWRSYTSYLPSLPRFSSLFTSPASASLTDAGHPSYTAHHELHYPHSPHSTSPPDAYYNPHLPHTRLLTFRHRLHRALLALRPAEALIMAFILGAGIGAVVHAVIVVVLLVLSKMGLIRLAGARVRGGPGGKMGGRRRGWGRRRGGRDRRGEWEGWADEKRVVREDQEGMERVEGMEEKDVVEGERLPPYDAAREIDDRV